MTEETALTIRPVSAIFVREHLERFHSKLLTEARQTALERQGGFDELEEGLRVATETGNDQQARRYRNQITRRKRDVERAHSIVNALEAGFVPMPRLPAVSLEYVLGIIPPDVLLAIEDAKTTGLFEELRVVDGRNAWADGQPRTWTAPKGRDPIIVGMIGDELFPIAWWK
jgi:hypothetical protein